MKTLSICAITCNLAAVGLFILGGNIIGAVGMLFAAGFVAYTEFAGK